MRNVNSKADVSTLIENCKISSPILLTGTKKVNRNHLKSTASGRKDIEQLPCKNLMFKMPVVKSS